MGGRILTEWRLMEVHETNEHDCEAEGCERRAQFDLMGADTHEASKFCLQHAMERGCDLASLR
jgi:hypothetical protein